jgi:hypothetical protein
MGKNPFLLFEGKGYVSQKRIQRINTHHALDTKHSKLIFSFCIALILFVLPTPAKVLAGSPIFNFQEIKDPTMDWINLGTKNPSSEGEPATEILSVDYRSDGNALNSTIWLSAPVKGKPTEYADLNYGMYIDADFDRQTGYGGIDYKVEIGWNNNTKTWSKTLEKWSPFGDTKTMAKEDNYTGFFERGKKYVELPLDLKALDYPSKYKITFYAEAKKSENNPLLTDFTKWVAIPPLQLTITTLPSIIELQKGDEKTIEIRVNSSQGYEPRVELSAKSQTNSTESSFRQNKTLHIPTYGMATTPLTVRALQDSVAGPYTLLIFANSTFPSEQLIDQLGVANNKPDFVPDISENIIAQSKILVTILEPPAWDENVKNYWDNIGGPTSFFYGIIAGLLPWIYNSIKNKKNKDGKNK